MLTGRAAELRPDINYLAPRRLFVPMPDQPVRTGLGSSEAVLREQCRVANIRRAQAKDARPRKPGAIPTSGRARSDAKRNQRAQSAAVQWRDITAETTEGWIAARGKQYEFDGIPTPGYTA